MGRTAVGALSGAGNSETSSVESSTEGTRSSARKSTGEKHSSSSRELPTEERTVSE
eukprot:CAMPEP_0194341976 /NCGR_PEP_ID=MMETSP0171-20130528/91380_1 /TAXON_ID=218684 /ORGANISM="Corethron pennatum, Strain L29A3" /LENGTH=55 /DNA_ID=CAMNT_0039107513 /DNA_START=18 /DNA_END=182 /DNA_ORIENTATION=+